MQTVRRTLVGIATVACLVAAAPAAATFPGANGRIAFVREPPFEQSNIFTMEPDGSDVRELQPGTNPSWSANGRWIVFVCFPETELYQQVCMMRPNGSNVRQVTTGGLPKWDPSFSPGGGKVLYYEEGLRTDPGGLFVINTNGSHVHVLDLYYGPAEWAPDGKHIAYGRPNVTAHEGAVWITRPDGTHRRMLYSGGGSPHYVPNGGSILFSGKEGTMQMGAFGGNPHSINTGPIDVDAQIAPAGGCTFGVASHPGTGKGSSVYAQGARCPETGFLTGGNAWSPSWQPLP
jgi:TolB protein